MADRRDKARKDRMWVEQLLCQAQARNWYGAITIKMEAGEIRLVTKMESLKPPSETG